MKETNVGQWDWALSCDCGPVPRKMQRQGCHSCLRKAVRRTEANLARAEEALRKAEAVIDALPRCSGEWLKGSGGHRTHGPCESPATHFDAGDTWAYCDAHYKEHDGIREADWADELRAYLASDQQRKESP